MIPTVVKIIDLTDEPSCARCLLEKITNSMRNEELACREQSTGIKLTTRQVDALELRYAPYPRRSPVTLFGLPVWEVEK